MKERGVAVKVEEDERPWQRRKKKREGGFGHCEERETE